MNNSHGDNSDRLDLLIPLDRFEAIRTWAEYIREQPVTDWGPEHTALVDAQLSSANAIGKTPEKERRIERIADDLSTE